MAGFGGGGTGKEGLAAGDMNPRPGTKLKRRKGEIAR